MAASDVKMEGFSTENPISKEYSTEYVKDEGARVEEGGLSDPNHVELQRALKARHITMIGMSSGFENCAMDNR